jgi:hypothetical protein
VAHKVSVEELRAFAEDERLQRLEEALTRFNIFEAIGATNEELRHSNFLAFLLDPKQNHRLGDTFARALLTYPTVRPELNDLESFEHIDVLREHEHTDILIIDRVHRYAIIIENKIWSNESENQLGSYWDTICEEFPDLRVWGIFLTPSGYGASDSRYLPLSYRDVAKVLSSITRAEGTTIHPDVRFAIEHYVGMLRRFIVGNADTDALARQIYMRHSQAIALMNPASWQKWIKRHLEGLIRAENSGCVMDSADLAYIRFAAEEWDRAPALKTGMGWTGTGRLMLFDFYNFADSLSLHLFIGPGPEEGRENLCELCRQNQAVFTEPRKVDTRWWQVYDLKFLGKEDYEGLSDEELIDKIDTCWKHFVATDLTRINSVFKSADWLWQPQQQNS